MSVPKRRSVRRRPVGNEQGQVVPLIAVAMVVMAAVAVVIVAVGGVVADRAVARTAADAAALAAAAETDPRRSDMAAERLATANGAKLVSIHRHGLQVEVEVRVGRASARARAEGVIEPVHSEVDAIP